MPVTKPNFELHDEYKQIALDLELPEVECDGVSIEEARMRSVAGHSALILLKGNEKQPAWFERFELLMGGGWPWRQAVYIAWASMPQDGRMPKTQQELATQYLQLTSDRAISTWRKKNAAINTMIAVLQSSELWEYRADAFKGLIDGMKNAGSDYKFFNHLKLFLEMSGDYVPLTQLAAVLKRKADGSAADTDEDTLMMLERGAQELKVDLDPSALRASPPNALQLGESGEEEE
jgi:hypothetical protein